MNILGQRDIRWKNKTINGTTSTIGNYGCTLTCLAMLADTTPDIVESKLEFSVDRIIWTSINKTDLPIRFPDMGRAYIYDNDKVKEAIDKNGGCLVEVDFDGVISTPNDRHWVLFVGNGKAYDPWTGTEILTTKYSILKGYCIINKTAPVINPTLTMTDEQKRILEFLNGKTEGNVREAFGALSDMPKKDEQIKSLSERVSSYEQKIKELETTITTLQGRIEENGKTIDSWQQDFKTANEQITKISEELEKIYTEKTQYRKWYEEALEKSADKLSSWELIAKGINKLFVKN